MQAHRRSPHARRASGTGRTWSGRQRRHWTGAVGDGNVCVFEPASAGSTRRNTVTHPIDRRRFLHGSLAGAALLATELRLSAADAKEPRLKKAVKYAMIKTKGSIQEKFELIKKLGFLGVEIDSPGAPNLDELNKAQEM